MATAVAATPAAAAASPRRCGHCGEPGATKRCGGCKLAFYCSVTCQGAAWKAGHKQECKRLQEQQQAQQEQEQAARDGVEGSTSLASSSFGKEKEQAGAAGYPREPLLRAHDAAAAAMLRLPTRKERDKADKAVGTIIFDDQKVRAPAPKKAGGCAIVPREDFTKAFHAFTGGLFAEDVFDSELWRNVVVAGGAVLGSLLPPTADHARWQPMKGAQWWEYDLYLGRRRRVPADDLAIGPQRTLEHFYAETLWPGSDVDIFVYGLSAAEAHAKALAVMRCLQRTLVMRRGASSDISFVKTANTLTLSTAGVRPVQIITRLYKSKADILNGFDIDACCCAWDGESALITPRAAAAIAHRRNIVNLHIRGAAYEHRLLKYVERGFVIAVPELKRSRLDREYLSIPMVPCEWWDGISLSSDGWRKWSASTGLTRLMLANNIAVQSGGMIEKPFAGRSRHRDDMRERELRFNVVPHPTPPGSVFDDYPGGKADKSGIVAYPATTHLRAFESNTDTIFKLDWKAGNMPRQPMSFDEWSKGACLDANNKPTAESPDSYDWKAAAEARRKKEEAEEKAERERQAAMESSRRVAVEAAAAAQREAAEANEAMRLAQQELERVRSEGADDSRLCVICLEAEKAVLFEKCKHVVSCEACSRQISECPLCRKKITRKVKVFL